MRIIAEGKENVLVRLEGDAISRSGKPGDYLLMQNEEGELLVVIAGHNFVGTGTFSGDGIEITTEKGLVTKVGKT